MTQVVVPKNYLCPISQEVMNEPVVVFETGVIYDKNSLTQIDDENLKNFTIFPLNDLKCVIQKFAEKISAQNQPEELEEDEQSQKDDQTLDQNIASQIVADEKQKEGDLTAISQNYQNQIKKIQNQNSVVEQHYNKVQNTCSPWKKLKRQFKQFETLVLRLQKVEIEHESSLQIQELLSNFVKFDAFIKNCIAELLKIVYHKKKFELQLEKLIEMERFLTDISQDFEKTLKESGMEAKSSKEFEILSKQYQLSKNNEQNTKFQDVDEQTLTSLLKIGKVVNISFILENKCQDITLKSDAHIKGLKITSTGEIQNWIVFKLQKKSKIVFQDCFFEGIGIKVKGNDGSSDVRFHDVEFQKTLSTALVVNNIASCAMSSIEVNNCGFNGIEVLTMNDCHLDYVQVRGCSRSGIYFKDTVKAEIKNCSLQNCGWYGVAVENNQVFGKNVEFVDNKKGEIQGNFTVE
eukprot:TRINITY_DN1207_c0_g1_i6.p1 TRINITY_DN1207_c0_g1~~TRINITY_DN1207_c0_g1_i6.p1  ORF type:complete len:498 (-),score=62.03 TRINITY_DN1207_c0_g1_i6:250-1635(-)